MHEYGGQELLVRSTVDDEWQTVASWGPEDAGSHFLHFTPEGSSAYLLDSCGANTRRLVKMNLLDSSTEILYEDEIYDVAGVNCDHETLAPLWLTVNREKSVNVTLDETVKADLDFLESSSKGEMHVVSRSQDNRLWVVSYVLDNGPTGYYLYARETKGQVFLFNHRSDLNGYELAPMEPISFASRDGLTLHGYLTLPVGETRSNLPVILLVHGGPNARDHWGFHSEVQWLINRGYAVLQVNFRGSSGYGKTFGNAGDREWGAKMQDDLTDGVKWAINRGIAD